ncbi:OLC1v1034043C1 [Oldenlandia corymbosa var. corymbosa]|uniref:OLC1v1034043C1 n=1 Tax=Oldenlandia corymbosa var. corymbosa TaxID=529605 RepID=A0AAV1CQX6_OLDCO|nr:OLC1v1034043C1 [Oldenlandia corymbosa var. corymbosa]
MEVRFLILVAVTTFLFVATVADESRKFIAERNRVGEQNPGMVPEKNNGPVAYFEFRMHQYQRGEVMAWWKMRLWDYSEHSLSAALIASVGFLFLFPVYMVAIVIFICIFLIVAFILLHPMFVVGLAMRKILMYLI